MINAHIRMLKTFIFMIALNILSVSAHAMEAVRRITKSEGSVTIERAVGDEVASEDDTAIFLGDSVETGYGSKALITFIDQTEITIAEDARLRIDEFVFNKKNNSANKARFNFMKGGFSYVSGLIAKKPDPDVRLDMAFGSIGIRGTEVWGGMLDKECRIYVENGEIDVFNEFGHTTLRHGQGTRIREARKSPTGTEVWGDNVITWIKSQVEFK
jgi:hypothetical protein